MKRLAMLTSALTLTGAAATAQEVVNVYNWSDYVAADTISNFEAQSGIKVVYDVFDSNEVLEAKMLTGASGYDVVYPSMEFLARQAQAGVFAEIDRALLTNYGNLDPAVLELVAALDPDNAHAVPYMSYSTGIGYNVEAIAARLDAEEIGSWDMLFNPDTVAKLADCGVAVLDSPTEVIAPVLNWLGLDPNSEASGDLDQAVEVLKSMRPHVRYFHSSQYINDLANGDICIALGYSGDIMQARDRAAEAGQSFTIAYTIPREGAQIGFDMMAIPADAPHKENAHAYINYILQPQVAADITAAVYFANPNIPATELVPDEVRNDPGIYPPDEVRAKMFAMKPHTPRFDRAATRAWTSVKTGR